MPDAITTVSKLGSVTRCVASLFAQERVDAPTSGPVKDDEEKHPAVHQGEFTSVHDRKKLRLKCRDNAHVKHEVGHCHLTASQERGEAREQPKSDQNPADKFDDSRNKCDPVHPMTATGKSEKLLPTVACVGQANNQPHDTVNRVCKSIQRVQCACAETTATNGIAKEAAGWLRTFTENLHDGQRAHC